MKRTRAQESRAAIEKLYITMRHLFMRGTYKPMGVSGESLVQALFMLNPEIYGLITAEEKVELDGLLYVMERLPKGIEECRFIRLISREGYEDSGFEAMIPPKRRRNCYRVDDEQMYVEMTRGRSDIYDILTHLTFLYVESEKIRKNSTDFRGRETLNWKMLREIVEKEERGEEFSEESAYSYLSHLTGRTFEETKAAAHKFEKGNGNSLYHIIYYLGQLSIEEKNLEQDREISFSATLRERVGNHVYGELWANRIKTVLVEENLIARPLHIISANMHSVVNVIYGHQSQKKNSYEDIEKLAQAISLGEIKNTGKDIYNYGVRHGLIDLPDNSGTNIGVQIIDTAQMRAESILPGINLNKDDEKKMPVFLVLDYAFGEQAFECMDELLKPFDVGKESIPLNVHSVSIMGKAGILNGKKGDIMIPTSHVFEGTADNYPINNELQSKAFEGYDLGVYQGPMISVMGTSLQNRDVLCYFMESSWQAIGLEMEGAHFQKAIQSASKIRGSIRKNVKVLYAYYASDNPLETGSTLASGSLGMEGVRPTYLITYKILERILS